MAEIINDEIKYFEIKFALTFNEADDTNEDIDSEFKKKLGNEILPFCFESKRVLCLNSQNIINFLEQTPGAITDVNFPKLNHLMKCFFNTIEHPNVCRKAILQVSDHKSWNTSYIFVTEIMLTLLIEAKNSLEYLNMVKINDEITKEIYEFCLEQREDLKVYTSFIMMITKSNFIKNFERTDWSKRIFPQPSSFNNELTKLYKNSLKKNRPDTFISLEPKIEALISKLYQGKISDLCIIPIWFTIGRKGLRIQKKHKSNVELASFIKKLYYKVVKSRKKNYPKYSIKCGDAFHNICINFEGINNEVKALKYYKETLKVYEAHDDYYIYPEVYLLADKVLRKEVDVYRKEELGKMKARVLEEVKTSPQFESMRNLFKSKLEEYLGMQLFHTIYRIHQYTQSLRVIYKFFKQTKDY